MSGETYIQSWCSALILCRPIKLVVSCDCTGPCLELIKIWLKLQINYFNCQINYFNCQSNIATVEVLNKVALGMCVIGSHVILNYNDIHSCSALNVSLSRCYLPLYNIWLETPCTCTVIYNVYDLLFSVTSLI